MPAIVEMREGDPDLNRRNDIEMLIRAVQDGGSVDFVITKLGQLIDEGGWRHLTTRAGEVVVTDNFETFVTTPPLKGLGSTVARIRRMVADDLVLVDRIDQLVRNAHGGDRSNVDNVNVARPTGNSQDQALRRLRDQRPDLHAQVLAGEVSPHGAMIQAGFRHRMITVRADDADAAIRTLLRYYTRDELVRALDE